MLRYFMVKFMSQIALMRIKGEPLDPKAFIMRPTPDMRVMKGGELPLEGALNFRDIGGYRTRDGKTVKYGKLYRSGELTSLTEADLDYLLNTLGVKAVCDLRNPEEVRASPQRFPAGRVNYLPLPILQGMATAEDGRVAKALFSGDVEKIDHAFQQTYITMIDVSAPYFGRALKLLADPANLPAITHCTAGKDRTGIIVALLLALLNVPDPAIIADYSLSNLAFERVYQTAKHNKGLTSTGLNPDVLIPILIAKPQWIDGTLRHIQHAYGSVEHYVTTAGGLSATDIQCLKDNFLE